MFPSHDQAETARRGRAQEIGSVTGGILEAGADVASMYAGSPSTSSGTTLPKPAATGGFSQIPNSVSDQANAYVAQQNGLLLDKIEVPEL